MKRVLLALLAVVFFASCGGAKDLSIEQSFPEWVEKNGKHSIKEIFKLDLDGDGKKELLTAYFISGYSASDEIPEERFAEIDSCEIVVEKDGVVYTHLWQYPNIKPSLNLAIFDAESGLMNFYFEGDGPSADPYTQVFSFVSGGYGVGVKKRLIQERPPIMGILY